MRPGLIGFAAWTAAGTLLAAALVSLASIGLLLLPFGIAASVLAARRWPHRAALAGLVCGAGLVCLGIGALNVDRGPCGPDLGPCESVSPWPWFAAGALAVAVALSAYAVLRRG